MRRRTFYLCLFLLLPVADFLSAPIETCDLAIWVAHGKYFLEHGWILRHDIFSALPTRELVYPWLTTVLYGAFYRLGGLAAVSLIHKLALLAFLALLYRASLGRLQRPWTLWNFALITVFYLGTIPSFADRPAILALIPFVVAFGILDRDRPLENRDLLALCAVMIAWVNLHGSWILLEYMFGWRLATRFTMSRALKQPSRLGPREWLGFVGVAACSLLNPFCYRVYPYVLETARLSRARGIDEWAVTGIFPYFPQGPLFFLLAALLVLAWCTRVRRHNAIGYLGSPYVGLGFIGFQSLRNTIWIFLALLPYAASRGWLRSENAHEDRRPRFLNVVVVGTLLALCVALLPPFKPRIAGFLPARRRPVYSERTPIALTEVLARASGPGAIFNDWYFGSYLALSQPHPIFLDTRNIIFTDREFGEYERVSNGEAGWQDVLRKYSVRYILADRREQYLLVADLLISRDWRILAQDSRAILFERIK